MGCTGLVDGGKPWLHFGEGMTDVVGVDRARDEAVEATSWSGCTGEVSGKWGRLTLTAKRRTTANRVSVATFTGQVWKAGNNHHSSVRLVTYSEWSASALQMVRSAHVDPPF